MASSDPSTRPPAGNEGRRRSDRKLVRRFVSRVVFAAGLLAVPLPFAGTAPDMAWAQSRPADAVDGPRQTAALPSGSGALPAPPAPARAPAGALLEDADAERYARILALQAEARWTEADRLIDRLADDRLMGHVLFQRYMHPTGWRSSWAELRDWLAAYADHPGASRIHALALRRRPAGAAAPRAPEAAPAPMFGTVERYGVAGCGQPRGAAAEAERRVRGLLADTRPTAALDWLTGQAGRLTGPQVDRLKGDIAAAYYFEGLYDRAAAVAGAAADRSGGQAPRAQWIAGLVAWRAGDWTAAAARFGAMAEAGCASPWGLAAGAFWAARAELRAGDFEAVAARLAQGSAYPRTFYGLLARRALGLEPGFSFDPPAPPRETLGALARAPAGARALALLQIGRADLAEAELMRLRPADGDRATAEAMIALAQRANLPRLALMLGGAVKPPGDAYYDGALYPLGPWQPAGGFTVDRALVHAVIRNESRFEPGAESWAGARGLMQLMPATARAMGGGALDDPANNLALGQRYIRELMADPAIGRDLVKIVVGYNAGPGNLRRWLDDSDHGGDPLLFMESVPSGQARAYAERVLASFWIYRMRLGQPTPSLDAVAAGHWPQYMSLDDAPTQVADHGTNR